MLEIPKSGTIDELRRVGLQFVKRTFSGLEEYRRQGDVSSHIYVVEDGGRRLFCLTYGDVV